MHQSISISGAVLVRSLVC